MILTDLQKFFDTVNHHIVLKKLGLYDSLEKQQNGLNLETNFSEPGNLLCWVSQKCILGPILFLLYIIDMPQAVDCELLLYIDGTCLIFQLKNITEIETALNNNFSILCDWFVDKLSIHFGEDKTKLILFGSKHNIKNLKLLNIQYNDIKIKQYTKVTYLGCNLVETLLGKSMAIN